MIAIQTKLGEFEAEKDSYYIITEVKYKSTDDDHICEFKCVPASEWRTAVDLIESQLEDELVEVGEF